MIWSKVNNVQQGGGGRNIGQYNVTITTDVHISFSRVLYIIKICAVIFVVTVHCYAGYIGSNVSCRLVSCVYSHQLSHI